VGSADTAFPHRFDFWDVPIQSQWSDPSESDRNIAWAREAWSALQPFSEASVDAKNLGWRETIACAPGTPQIMRAWRP